jgi:hypothetical protein
MEFLDSAQRAAILDATPNAPDQRPPTSAARRVPVATLAGGPLDRVVGAQNRETHL